MADQVTTSLAQAKVLVMEGQKGADGKSPYIGANGNWFVWNGTAWVDTGIPASLDDAQIAAAVEEYLEEHPVEITVDDALSDTSENPVQNKVVDAALNQKGTYSKPSGGIPKSDLAQSVQDALDNADDAYQKPSGGIPKTDLAADVQTSLGKADTALQQHQSLSGYATETWVEGKGYQTAQQVQTAIAGKADASSVYTKTEVDQKLVGAMDYKGTKATVSELPTSGNATGDVWHIDADGSEWAWNGSTWEELGTAVDLSGYRTASAQDAIDAAQNTAIAAKYTKPSTGIPKTDLASDVKASLGKADTALQSHQSLAAYRTATAQDTIDAGKLGTTGNAYRSASIPMGHLDSTSTATVMTATVDGITELRDGVCMWLGNGVITSASGFTLNVNGLGAKPCYSSLAAASRSTTIFNVNYTMLFLYNSTRVDGGCWDIVYGVDTNTTYTPVKLGFGYGTCTTAAATAAKTASISSYALTAGGIVSIKFDNDVPSGATLNISSKGAKAIYYRGAAITADVIKGGDTATFVYSTYYHLIAIDRDESGDVLPSVTASDNGKFLRVVSGAWAVQAVPSAEGASF